VPRKGFPAQIVSRYWERRKAGRIVVRVEVDAEVLDFLVGKACWLSEAEGLDPAKIGLAIAMGLKVSTRG
jgi:hypothetical protein